MSKVRFVDDGLPCLTQRVCAQHSDWHILIGCLLLTKTDRKQARPALEMLFDRVPGPAEAAALKDPEDKEALRDVLEPCGLLNRRFQAIVELSRDYLDPSKRVPLDLSWVGKYAIDSYDMFALGAELHVADVEDPELTDWLVGFWEGRLEHWRVPAAMKTRKDFN